MAVRNLIVHGVAFGKAWLVTHGLGAFASEPETTPVITYALGSYVATQSLGGSVLTAVLAGSYSQPLTATGSVLLPVLGGSYVSTIDLEGSV